jgi:hypothetical protein
MDQRAALATRVRNESSNTTDQTHHAEPEENANQHSDVEIEIDGNLGGRGVASLSRGAFPHCRDNVIAR